MERLSRGGEAFAVANHGTVDVFRVEDGERVGSVVTPLRPSALAVSEDGSTLVTGHISTLPVLIVWDAASGTELARMKGHTGAVVELELSRDERTVVSRAIDRTIRAWSIEADRHAR